MSYEKRKKRRLLKKTFRILIISFIFIYLAFRSIPIILANNAKTILPVEDVLINHINTQGIIIKDEKVYRAEGSGQLDIKIKEGERVPAGIEVANIHLLGDTSQLKMELLEIENSINALSKSDKDKELLNSEKTKILEIKDKLIGDLQRKIYLGEYEEIHNIKSELSLYDSKVKDISFENTLLGQSLETLKERREILLNEIQNNNLKYYTIGSGIVSYLIDGFETVYLPKEFENYTYENLKVDQVLLENKELKNVELNTPVFKLIDNFQWFIALKIENPKEIDDYSENNKITIQIENDQMDLQGTILKINKSKDKAVLLLRFDNYLHDYYNLRFPKVNIIKSKKAGFKIPSKTIIEKDGQKGVYIKEINGIVKFRPISILGEKDDYTYIDKGDSKGYIKLKGSDDVVKTITLYDEIFLNTSNIKEGQILN